MSGSVRLRPCLILGLIIVSLTMALQVVQGDDQVDQVPSEVQCRPYIEKALKDRQTGSIDEASQEDEGGEGEDEPIPASTESQEDDSNTNDQPEENDDDGKATLETVEVEDEKESGEETAEEPEREESVEEESVATSKADDESSKDVEKSEEGDDAQNDTQEEQEETSKEASEEQVRVSGEDGDEGQKGDDEEISEEKAEEANSVSEEVVDVEKTAEEVEGDSSETKEEKKDRESEEKQEEVSEEKNETAEEAENSTDGVVDTKEDDEVDTQEEVDTKEEEEAEDAQKDSREDSGETPQVEAAQEVDGSDEQERVERDTEDEVGGDETGEQVESAEEVEEDEGKSPEDDQEGAEDEESAESTPEEELIQEIEIPENLRPREHLNQILRLDQDNEIKEAAIEKASDVILKELKRLYDTAIKPLETLYKYRDLSNRHFGDPEIFSKPLVLFMGPWSGGKSSIINYLLDTEYEPTALRTGAEPSPAYFNIVMHGEEEEVLDGTQLAADWTFSGLQKFGQGMLDRLRGLKLPHRLLEKVNIVEIPGILEIRKQVQRLFPFNDACQWFIDRADIIFLVYDPSKLDVGPETEAILDQLKGREYQTRIILNKADQVKPEELMRVQGALIWNISPLMSSAEPPIMYSTSLWSLPYEAGAPTRLLYAQERAFLRDLRSAIDKRVEHKIASARRFAVRVRNHAKMVDCYLTTYYNHKTFFGNKKEISDRIIENPQDYHIYEGLSTLTNISRYDLPDPDVYRDFFRLNSLYDFPPLSSTCTYFRGCPINRLDVAIAYDLPELVGKYKKLVESTINSEDTSNQPPTS
ncbi:sarcalumenin [Diachasmimorpha longicaudata]|uniref:sarcalumenin n=1 Tax=Diachasmimorpha longicaudata TaxID=58733 RepID=UPI0030B8793B